MKTENNVYTIKKVRLGDSYFSVEFPLPAFQETTRNAEVNNKLSNINLITNFSHDENITITVNVFNKEYEKDEFDMPSCLKESIELTTGFKEELAFEYNIPTDEIYTHPKELSYIFSPRGVKTIKMQNYFYAQGQIYCMGNFIAFVIINEIPYSFVFTIYSSRVYNVNPYDSKVNDLAAINNDTFDEVLENVKFHFPYDY